MRVLAIVTGGNRGIGFEIAKGLLKAKNNGSLIDVIITARDVLDGKKSAAKLIQETSCAADQIYVERLDVTDENSISEFAHQVNTKYGKLDILIHNAGIFIDHLAKDNQIELKDKTLLVNYFGLFKLNKLLWPLLLESKEAHAIFVSSQLGKSAYDELSGGLKDKWSIEKITSEEDIDGLVHEFSSVFNKQKGQDLKKHGWCSTSYGLTKLAVIARAKLLSLQPQNKSIFIASVCPGFCDTDMTKGMRAPRTAAKGAETPVYLALLDSQKDKVTKSKTGEFWYDQEIISFLGMKNNL